MLETIDVAFEGQIGVCTNDHETVVPGRDSVFAIDFDNLVHVRQLWID